MEQNKILMMYMKKYDTYLVSTSLIILHLSAQAADIIVVCAPESINAFTGNLFKEM